MNEDVIAEIDRLKSDRGAVILAHNYTTGDIQDIADYVGDSLELSRKAAECGAAVIVFCGVRFMAETAKILSPDSIVLHPAPEAGCPMADMADPDAVAAYRAAHPDALLVAYVNTTAATKREVDLCCTSGNVDRIVAAIPADRRIMFLPDGNLGRNVAAKSGRRMEFWPGCCPIHDRISVTDLMRARRAHPGAPVLVHPECRPEVVTLADQALSTGGMLEFVRKSPGREFIIGTESGILYRMRKENPGKRFFPLDPEPVCTDMKKITLTRVRDALRDLSPRIELDEETIRRAAEPIRKMLAVR
ncbi:MAG: quinolinate synthase NadA [Lentisphaeria bacterium]|nr:quinolinate synthase NadA [Lentisphaeria bacterium]